MWTSVSLLDHWRYVLLQKVLHFILYTYEFKQKQILDAIKSIDATWDTNTTTTSETNGASEYSHTNTDNETDFKEEEEKIQT